MNFLIDTNVLIWLAGNNHRIGPKTLSLLKEKSNRVCLSYFSLFEMKIKSASGKLHYDESIVEDLPKMGIELVMPNTDVLLGYKLFDQSNKDPFGNILVSVALQNDLTMVTSDRKILDLKESLFRVFDACE